MFCQMLYWNCNIYHVFLLLLSSSYQEKFRSQTLVTQLFLQNWLLFFTLQIIKAFIITIIIIILLLRQYSLNEGRGHSVRGLARMAQFLKYCCKVWKNSWLDTLVRRSPNVDLEVFPPAIGMSVQNIHTSPIVLVPLYYYFVITRLGDLQGQGHNF